MALNECAKATGAAAAKRNITRAVELVASRLGNTAAICRKSYIHPEIVGAYLDGKLLLRIRNRIDQELSRNLHALRPEEAAVLAFLRSRIARDLDKTSLRRAAAPPVEQKTAKRSSPRRKSPKDGRRVPNLAAQIV